MTSCIITGTRPEIIKMAPVYRALQSCGVSVSWCHTGQHGDLAKQMFNQFEIKPDWVLTRPPGGTIANLTAGLINEIDQLLGDEKVSLVCVHGDTTTALAGAMAAFYRQIPVAHIEAGLRSFNMHHPFPEESNRKMVGTIAVLHYPPTELAARNLRNENVAGTVLITGNTVVDAQKWILEHYDITAKRENIVLITAHRRENWNQLDRICEAIRELAARHPELLFIFPVHPNPKVSTIVYDKLSNILNVQLRESVDYLTLQRILSRSCLTITDSGGIQEEAPGLGVQSLVMRKTTERPEAVESGWSFLVGTESEKIVEKAEEVLQPSFPKGQAQPFGDGFAARRIAEDIRAFLDQ